MSTPGPETFAANARAALDDATLRGALRRATDTFAERRAAALAGVPEWEALREEARAIKAHTLARLDHYLEEFAAKAAPLICRADRHGANIAIAVPAFDCHSCQQALAIFADQDGLGRVGERLQQHRDTGAIAAQQVRFGRIDGEVVCEGGHAHLLAGAALAAHVHLRGRVAADQQHGESRRAAVLGGESGDAGRQRRAQRGRHALAIDDAGRHV